MRGVLAVPQERLDALVPAGERRISAQGRIGANQKTLLHRIFNLIDSLGLRFRHSHDINATIRRSPATVIIT